MILPFSSLSSSQRAQAAATFRDDFFGTHPEDYLYEASAAMEELTGQRIPMKPKPIKRTRPKNMPFRIAKSSPLALSDQAARWLARNLISSLTVSAPVVHAEAG